MFFAALRCFDKKRRSGIKIYKFCREACFERKRLGNMSIAFKKVPHYNCCIQMNKYRE